jgi:SAM-dependent methyltransferase
LEPLTGQDQRSYWNSISAQFYLSIPPPLRLVDEDVRHYFQPVSRWCSGGAPPRVLIMGVTPEFYFMPWPDGTDILAVDKSEHMIRNVWPGKGRQALCADWTGMALPDRSRDLAFCDGGLSFIEWPGQAAILAANLARILAPGGIFVTRIYDPGPSREDPARVMTDLLEGRISNSAILKLRLAMALSAPPQNGIKLDDIWRFYSNAVPDSAQLPARTAWSDAEISAIEAYAGSQERYYFPTSDEVRATFCEAPGGFECRAVEAPAYEFHAHLRYLTFDRT